MLRDQNMDIVRRWREIVAVKVDRQLVAFGFVVTAAVLRRHARHVQRTLVEFLLDVLREAVAVHGLGVFGAKRDCIGPLS